MIGHIEASSQNERLESRGVGLAGFRRIDRNGRDARNNKLESLMRDFNVFDGNVVASRGTKSRACIVFWRGGPPRRGVHFGVGERMNSHEPAIGAVKFDRQMQVRGVLLIHPLSECRIVGNSLFQSDDFILVPSTRSATLVGVRIASAEMLRRVVWIFDNGHFTEIG